MTRDLKIQEQSNIITQQNDMLRKMAKSMLDRGLTIEDIAAATGKSAESISRPLNN